MTTISDIHFTVEADDGFFGEIKNIKSDLDETDDRYKDVVYKILNTPTRYGQILGKPGTASNAFCVLAEPFGGECVLVEGDISYPSEPGVIY